MSQGNWVQIVALFGWLILAASGFASYRLGWRESIRMALLWAGIFVAVALVFSLAMG
ncbi:hypothetical protein [Tsuneonella mangrovi]|uniref:hypothetical protein n=1 Tax=Tsuneonella mangrovi TaxID=1982042 RepID=UPI001470E111|nr:hypothetical protein [Tsuneonella mangrovi]